MTRKHVHIGARLVLASERVHINGTAGRAVPRPRENSRQVRERFAEGFASILVLDPPADLRLTRFAQGVLLSRRRENARAEALLPKAWA